jgi:23S rRNA (adenine2503-C2)-methyltransferase
MAETSLPIDIFSLTSAEFAAAAAEAAPATAGLAGAVYEHAFRTGVLDPQAAGASAENSTPWHRRFFAGVFPAVSIAEEDGEAGRTTKFVFRLADGNQIESVAIPMFGGTSTVCVSSQVGCARACAFCETGRAGLTRDLAAAKSWPRSCRHPAPQKALRNVVSWAWAPP